MIGVEVGEKHLNSICLMKIAPIEFADEYTRAGKEKEATQGQPKGKAETPVVTREWRRNSRKTTWLPSEVQQFLDCCSLLEI